MRDESNRCKPDQAEGSALENLFRFGALQLDKNPSQKSAEGYLENSQTV